MATPRKARTQALEEATQSSKIMTMPLPQILEELDNAIKQVAEAVDSTNEAAQGAREAAANARIAGKNAAAEAQKAVEKEVGSLEEKVDAMIGGINGRLRKLTALVEANQELTERINRAQVASLNAATEAYNKEIEG